MSVHQLSKKTYKATTQALSALDQNRILFNFEIYIAYIGCL